MENKRISGLRINADSEDIITIGPDIKIRVSRRGRKTNLYIDAPFDLHIDHWVLSGHHYKKRQRKALAEEDSTDG